MWPYQEQTSINCMGALFPFFICFFLLCKAGTAWGRESPRKWRENCIGRMAAFGQFGRAWQREEIELAAQQGKIFLL